METQTRAKAAAPRQRAQRLEARVTRDQKQLIERAASIQGRTVTDFVITALQDAARKTVEDSNVWRLSQKQQETFLDALMNPPAPNRKLRAVYRRYRKSAGLPGH